MSNSLKLFYAPQVCSLAPHIALREVGAPVELVRVDLRTRRTADGGDFTALNPKGYVPAITLPDGSLLTETAVILRYVADTWPEAGLAPREGLERLRFDELLQFIATELHKGFAPFTIMPNPGEESRRWAADRLTARVALLGETLGDREFLHGTSFTVADAYAFFALRVYTARVKAELPPVLTAYLRRLSERPSVRAALQAEGVL